MRQEDPLARIETSLYWFGWAVLALAAGLVTLACCFGMAILAR